MAKVTPMPLSADQALKIIRKTAENSERVKIPTDLGFTRPYQEWQHVVTDRQIKRCIDGGEILGKPRIDEHGNLECELCRFGGGEEITIKIVLVSDPTNGWNLFVTEWGRTDGF